MLCFRFCRPRALHPPTHSQAVWPHRLDPLPDPQKCRERAAAGPVPSKPFGWNRGEDSTDDELLRDEIDAFHVADRTVSDSDYRRKKEVEAEEILNVEGDEEESSDDDSDAEGFDSDADDDGISANQWGRERKGLYGADYVDEDYGRMEEKELEDAQIEEEDAVDRQKKLDAIIQGIVLPESDDDEEQILEEQEELAQDEFSLGNVTRNNRKLKRLMETLAQKMEIFKAAVEPLLPVAKRLPEGSPLKEEFMNCYEIYTTYLMNVVFYLKLKSGSFAEKKVSDEEIDAHPVLDTVKLFKIKVDEVDKYLGENSDEINEIVKAEQAGSEQFGKICELERAKAEKMKVDRTGKKKKKSKVAVLKGANEQEEEMAEHELGAAGDGKRKATDAIVANKTKAVKQKKGRIAKTRNRARVKAIEKRVKSQIAPIRREIDKYSGEAKGIRISTIKSTKLIA
ncbi:hypothetical protein WR25_15226 [Diploscapter pachys]|uniref:Sas10 C-terminal domain-containing protein n=1 Tax=Diploscapter pachys TaxID=2018661 RepID=A0A2A2LUJ4_9BILA|nr:hypothetical protein WR25_15226 [Diploscapter pachys]